jgi:hypothetical protein
MDKRDDEKINALVNKMMLEDDDERRTSLADRVLELDPDNAIGKYIKWQSFVDPESTQNQDTTLLEEAIASLKPEMEARFESAGDEDDWICEVYVSMLSDLASILYISGDHDRAFEAAADFVRFDMDSGMTGRAVYFGVLAERGEFERIISALEDDAFENLPGEHCRAMAEFELNGPCEESAQALLSAISIDPDVPYYMLGLQTIDDDDEIGDDYRGYIEDFMMTVAILSEAWAANEDRLAFFSHVAFIFGYLTGRMDDPEDMAMIEDTCREIGCLGDLKESRDVLHAMLAAGGDPAEADERALAMFEENNYFGMFDE